VHLNENKLSLFRHLIMWPISVLALWFVCLGHCSRLYTFFKVDIQTLPTIHR